MKLPGKLKNEIVLTERTSRCQYSVIENKLAVISENQHKLMEALIHLEEKIDWIPNRKRT